MPLTTEAVAVALALLIATVFLAFRYAALLERDRLAACQRYSMLRQVRRCLRRAW
jgi:hypothetical protein